MTRKITRAAAVAVAAVAVAAVKRMRTAQVAVVAAAAAAAAAAAVVAKKLQNAAEKSHETSKNPAMTPAVLLMTTVLRISDLEDH
jgi:zinc transporter ZupT